MIWWIWALIGLAFVLAELATPGFFIIFFSVGAFSSSAIALLWPGSPLWIEILAFSVISLVSMVLFRKPLMKRFGLDNPASSRTDIVEESATPLEDIGPGGAGKAELRGTTWNARNGGSTKLAKGQLCKVERVDGLTLWLKAE